MKEFETPLSKLFLPGLRTENRAPRNSPGLTVCKNVQPIAGALDFHMPLLSPITAPEASLDWPFPTVMFGPSGRYVGTRHYLYKVGVGYALTQLTAWFPSAERWELTDFHTYQVLINGNLAILVDVPSGDFRFAPEFPACKTLINFKGQLVCGNTVDGINWISWSKIGYNDFTIEADNEAGVRPLPVVGPIHRLMYMHTGADMGGRDRGSFVAYAEDGIVISKPYSEPTLAWGIKSSNTAYGIPSFGCVGGTEDEHIFIDNKGYLHQLTTKGDQILGYKEFFQSFITEDVVILFDQIEQQYYLSTENKCYVLGKQGLGEIDQIISSGWIEGSEFNVTGYMPSSLTIELSSDELDFNIRASKFISTLSFGIKTDGYCTASVSYLNDQTNTYHTTEYKPLSPAGICYPMVAGVDFKVNLKCQDFTYFKLDEASLKWKLVDKHSTRGPYANAKATAGAD